MCTYDYTPYKGCEDGPQHYYIQWVKCDVAVERGRYCSLEASQKVEQLRKLSVNVLSCPLHGPIAVQQFVLEQGDTTRLAVEERERSRARSAARRRTASRGRSTRRGGHPDWDDEEELVNSRRVHRRRSRREIAVESSDSEQSDLALSTRRRTEGRQTRRGHRDAPEERRTIRDGRPHGHRRTASADVDASMPSRPPPPLSMRYGRSEVSLPLKTDFGTEGKEDDQESTTRRQRSRPRNSVDTGNVSPGLLGLPSSPDMHRRDSLQRAKSELGLRPGVVDSAPEPMPASKSPVSPTSDSSPDNNQDLPLSNRGRMGRKTGARSIRDRSVDTTMKRIDEDVAQDENAAATRDTAASTIRSSSTTRSSAQPQQQQQQQEQQQQQGQDVRPRGRSSSRPRLKNLQIPTVPEGRTAKYHREAHSAPTATPPETDLNRSPSQATRHHRRAGSHHSIDLPTSPTTTTGFPQHFPLPPRSTGSGDGARKASLPGHLSMSSTNLPLPPPGLAGEKDRDRGSVDSGYLSGGGHHNQSKPQAQAQAQAQPHDEPKPQPQQQQQQQHRHEPKPQVQPRTPLPRPEPAASSHYIPPDQLWNRGDIPPRSTTAPPASFRSPASSHSGVSPVEPPLSPTRASRLQKSPPLPPLPQNHPLQQQQQYDQNKTRLAPAPLNLANANTNGGGSGSTSLSPGLRSDSSTDGKGPKATLLQRIGLRRKFSGLVGRDRDRAGQRSEVGVES